MVRTKKILITMLITALMAAVTFLAANTSNSYALNDVIRPHKPTQAIELSMGYNGGILQVSTTANSNYSYQYWIKTKVATDLSDNLANEQFIWQMVRGFNDGNETANLTVTDNNKENGKYHVIVRVKEGTKLIDEIYGSYRAIGISEVKVDDKAAQGEIIISRSSTAKIEIISHYENVASYSLYYGEEKTTPFTNSTGEFNLPMNSYQTGYNIFRAEIETATGEKDTKYIKVYVYDEYVANQRPVITSLTGDTDWQNGGITTFTMNVEYADGKPIPLANATNYNFRLRSGGINLISNIVDTQDGTFKVQFAADYNGKNGIYYTEGTVSREGINGEDDKIIRYYDGYARSATLQQSAKDSSENDLALSSYTIAVGQTITITATGSITGAVNDLEYGFYREDASGWVMIKNYSTSNTLTWTPTRAGTYNIQARIKEKGAGSYEKTANIIYNITNVNLTGNLDIKIYDYETNSEVNVFVAGRPYKLEASYSGTEELLYMFTLSSKNLGVVYLNNFTASPYIMFIPAKADDYRITARAISLNSFGYMDINSNPFYLSSFFGLKNAETGEELDQMIIDIGSNITPHLASLVKLNYDGLSELEKSNSIEYKPFIKGYYLERDGVPTDEPHRLNYFDSEYGTMQIINTNTDPNPILITYSTNYKYGDEAGSLMLTGNTGTNNYQMFFQFTDAEIADLSNYYAIKFYVYTQNSHRDCIIHASGINTTGAAIALPRYEWTEVIVPVPASKTLVGQSIRLQTNDGAHGVNNPNYRFYFSAFYGLEKATSGEELNQIIEDLGSEITEVTVSLIKLNYDGLTEAEKANATLYKPFLKSYYLERDGVPTDAPHRLNYFDSEYGLQQIISTNTAPNPILITYSTAIKYGSEAGSIMARGATGSLNYQMFLQFTESEIGDLSGYSHVKFYVYTQNPHRDCRIGTFGMNPSNIELPRNVWTEVILPVPASGTLVGQSIRLQTNSGSHGVNSPDYRFYFSAFYGIPKEQ